ncbi:uncharacterized protein BDZ99DRAFT_210908 [Mytilinidion resinicola]|uniref:DUF7025 domain-containing protein n=1 Tax=Mytilinidion resinicola TaxID=574789 RepID=A0A6A6Y1U0_9PEZI|nr:uncharacterized protein BDZ99DRAFT_210908 [Mytilinidion resinicola]KAF2802195.1 hypothetical protein BDZ99DRAFT_210908 [Mytilinidion resinicola]
MIPRPKPTRETIRLESQDMIESMEAFIAGKFKFIEEHPDFDVRAPLAAPYLFWYHDRSPETISGLNDLHQKHMRRLTGWIDDNYGEMYHRVEKQLDKGVVSYESIEFLMKPGDAIILNNKPGQEGGTLKAEIAASWPASKTPQKLADFGVDSPWVKMNKDHKKKCTWKWIVDCWAYKYDGSFYRTERQVEIQLRAEKADEEVAIQKLNVYPLRYASEETRALLEQRGRTFWSCRDRRLVSYEDKNGIYGVCFPAYV